LAQGWQLQVPVSPARLWRLEQWAQPAVRSAAWRVQALPLPVA
jgi:hypothetical protein